MTPKIVGLTGGMGSGKSTVRQMLHNLGVPCVDADIVAREIHQKAGHPALGEIALAFPHAMTPDGRLSRGSLHKIFAIDAGANNRLKTILGPYVVARMSQWTAEQKTPYVVWESALIIEAKIRVDRIMVVDIRRELQIARVLERNPHWNAAQIESILALQLDRADRVKYAHDTICNDGSFDNLQRQVRALHSTYLELWGTT